MKICKLAALSCALAAVMGCSRQETAYDTEYTDQVAQYWEQAEEAKRQLAKSREQAEAVDQNLEKSKQQSDRLDALLTRWEEQADRQDKIFARQESVLTRLESGASSHPSFEQARGENGEPAPASQRPPEDDPSR